MILYYTEPTAGTRDRLYARLETEMNRETLANVTFGTVAREHITPSPVQSNVQHSERLDLTTIDDHYATQIRDDFEARTLGGFIDELVERTPYAPEEAEVIVTHGWFNMSVRDSIRAINQYRRETYDELTEQAFRTRLAEAQDTRTKIHNASQYPFEL